MQSKRKKIALLHHTGGGNLGDDATLEVVIQNIRRRWPEADITVFSMNPSDTARKYGVESYPIRRHTWNIGYASAHPVEDEHKEDRRFKLRRKGSVRALRGPQAVFRELVFLSTSFKHLKSFDLLIVSGGGQLTERSGPWGFPYAIFIWILMARIARVRCIFLNVGAGPLNHPFSKFLVVRALSAAQYVSFRDHESQALTRRIGFTGPSRVFPDSVYSTEVVSANTRLSHGGAPVVGIAPMPFPFCDPREYRSGQQAIYDELLGKLAVFASSLVSRSYSLNLFGSDIGADPSAIEDLGTVLRKAHNISTPPYDPVDSVIGLLSKMSRMDYVVTCRFHGVVFAHLLNKPVLAISHHPKVANLMNALGLSKYCVDIQTFDPGRLVDTFVSLANDTEVRKLMAASLARYKAQLMTQFDDLFPRSSNELPIHQLGVEVPGYRHRALSGRRNS
jgi:polysaccharide pyruvyl transferase WcaK-like protein